MFVLLLFAEKLFKFALWIQNPVTELKLTDGKPDDIVIYSV